jgi:hypothetical protein
MDAVATIGGDEVTRVQKIHFHGLRHVPVLLAKLRRFFIPAGLDRRGFRVRAGAICKAPDISAPSKRKTPARTWPLTTITVVEVR